MQLPVSPGMGRWPAVFFPPINRPRGRPRSRQGAEWANVGSTFGRGSWDGAVDHSKDGGSSFDAATVFDPAPDFPKPGIQSVDVHSLAAAKPKEWLLSIGRRRVHRIVDASV